MFIIIKMPKYLIIVKMTSFKSLFAQCYETEACNLYTFSVALPIINENSKILALPLIVF